MHVLVVLLTMYYSKEICKQTCSQRTVSECFSLSFLSSNRLKTEHRIGSSFSTSNSSGSKLVFPAKLENSFKMPSLRSSLTTASRENNENEASNKQSSVQVSQSNDQTGQSSNSPPSSVSSADQARSSGIKLALPWNTRDHIIIRLNQFSKLLFGQTVSEEVKEEAVKQTNSLVTALIGLVSSDAQTGNQERSVENVRIEERPKKKARVEKKTKKSVQIDESGESNATRPFFLIPLRLRSEVIDQLIRNMDAVCYSTGSLDESSRNRLREQNDRLNLQLLSLSVTLMKSTSADESDPFQLPSSKSSLYCRHRNIQLDSYHRK